MKIIVTGGCGFIGSYIVEEALRRNYNVLNIDKLSYASSNLKIKNKRYKFLKLDISSEKIINVIKKFEPDKIIHCAAESHVDRSILKPKQFIDSNIVGTFNILNAVLELKKKTRILHISTDEVFGSLKLRGKKKFGVNTKYDPKSPYSASKASSDHLVRAFGHTYKIDYVITNCSNNFGPRQYKEKFIPVIINSCLKEGKIPVYGNGKNIRDWIFVKDHVNGIFKCLINGKSQHTYLIGANKELNNLQIVKKICKIMDRIKKRSNSKSYTDLITYVKDRPGHDLKYAIDSSKIRRELKWKPNYNFDEALELTIKSYVF